MSIDLRNFVQINLNYFLSKSLNRIRNTAVLLTCDPENTLDKTYSSKAGYDEDVTAATMSNSIESYIKCFFANGGLKLHVIGGYIEPLTVTVYKVWDPAQNEFVDHSEVPASGHLLVDNDWYVVTENAAWKQYSESTHEWSDLDAEPQTGEDVTASLAGGLYYVDTHEPSEEEKEAAKISWLKEKVLELDYTEIVVTTDQSLEILELLQQDDSKTELVNNALVDTNLVKTLTGYKEKIYIGSTNDEDVTFDSRKNWSNLVVKFGHSGIEMAAAAYLTQINVNDSKTIADYCFTIESVDAEDIINSNSKVVSLSDKNVNVNTKLVNAVRNVWGNTIGGHDLMNYFMKILLTQTLTERIVDVLASKIKYDKSGINIISNTMVQELNIYKNNGYLNTGDIWTEDDLYYTYHGVDYLVCKKNTPLTSGYKFVILPITSLTPEQKQAHVFPPIYLLISDSISIRQILIVGDIY